MGSHFSKRADESPSLLHIPNDLSLAEYQNACALDSDIKSFDATLQARTSRVITSLAEGAEVHTLSFDSLKEITGSLLEMNQQVVQVILDCKKDIWKNRELFQLVEEYFENSLHTLDFCTVLEKCLKRATDRQLLLHVALQLFEEEDDGQRKYSRTLQELENFKNGEDPFDEEFFQVFHCVYKQQMLMLEKLQERKSHISKKIKSVKAWRKVSCIIFASAFAAVIICSVVAAAIAAPPVAAALAAAASVPLGSMGKWVDSLWKNCEDLLKGQKEIITSMQVGTYVAIKDLDNIRVLVDKLEILMRSLADNADFSLRDENALKLGIQEIERKLDLLTGSIEDLSERIDSCSRDIRRARTVVLQRIMKQPTRD